VLREVVLDGDTPLGAFVKVARPPFAFLLESVVGGERWARYTFLGTEPREVWRYRAAHRAVERWTKPTGWRAAGETEDPIGHLAQRMRALPAAPCRACRASPAARWATWATTWCAPSSVCRAPQPTRSTCRTP